MVLLGDVHVIPDDEARGGGAQLAPDEASPTFALDPFAASAVFLACQQLHVQLVVLTPSATAAAPLPSFVYDELATLGHPVARRLREGQRAALQEMWHAATMPPGHPARLGFTGGRAWFARTFCGGADLTAVSAERHIWPYVKEFSLCDPLGLLACHPATLSAFYEVTSSGGAERAPLRPDACPGRALVPPACTSTRCRWPSPPRHVCSGDGHVS